MIALFRNPSGSRNAMSASAKARRDSNGATPETAPASGLYADTENLQNYGQNLVRNLVDNWPPSAPPLALLSLYVQADRAELWRAWATSEFGDLRVIVRGIQRFSGDSSKNSADMAIASNAMADWLLGRISHVAVLSDDSDFIALYAAMRQELTRSGRADDDVPFTWAVTDRKATVSEMASRFFPKDRLHVVPTDAPTQDANESEPSSPVSPPAPLYPPPPTGHPPTDIAQAVVATIPVGLFKSTDCADIIRDGWPDHPLASADGATFGMEFKNSIWPMLRLLGVRIPDQSVKPLRYEMTQDAKTRAQS